MGTTAPTSWGVVLSTPQGVLETDPTDRRAELVDELMSETMEMIGLGFG